MAREILPYQIELNNEEFWVVDKPSTRLEYLRNHPEMHPRAIGLVALGVFREKTYADYAAIARIDDETGTETWVRAYEAYEWVDWMAGTVYRDEAREKQLRNTERKLGSFLITFGWAPDYVLETEPSEYEVDGFIQHVANKDECDGNLYVPED